MRWYFPSWNGDFRLEPDPTNPRHTRLSVARPTAYEQQLLRAMETVFRAKGWWKGDEPLYTAPSSSWLFRSQKMVTVVIEASLAEIGPVVATHMKAGASTLTAIVFESGKVTVAQGVEGELAEAMKLALPAPEPEPAAVPETPDKATEGTAEAKPVEAAKAPDEKTDAPKAAASVRRPTPCCPQCIPGSVEPATEVLLDFLTPEQHKTWAEKRQIFVTGAYTEVTYRISHRHSAQAQRDGRVCFSLDDNAVVHFHATEVPPEEEILAAKLILEHREDWLRNEATLFRPNPRIGRFKNPFGDGGDGVADAVMMEQIGKMLGFHRKPGKLRMEVPV